MNIEITRVASEQDLNGILTLQQKNLRKNISPETAQQQGFVTAEHSFELIKKLNENEKSIIAKDGDTVVGYALVMLPDFKGQMSVFDGLFETLDHLLYEAKPITTYKYVVVGQLCVGDGYRGVGLVNMLYNFYRESLENTFEICVTDISSKNERSRKAHEKAGFQVIQSFHDDFTDEQWDIVLWDWRKK